MKHRLTLSAFLLIFLCSLSIAFAKPPLYPELLEQPPDIASSKANIHLSDGTILQDVLVQLWNNTGIEDPAVPAGKKAVIKFYRPPMKTSVYLGDISSVEFERQSGSGIIEPGDTIKLTLKNGNSDKVEYIDGLNDGLTIIYLDNFSGYYQKLYLPIYETVPGTDGDKRLKIKQIQFLQ